MITNKTDKILSIPIYLIYIIISLNLAFLFIYLYIVKYISEEKTFCRTIIRFVYRIVQNRLI